MASRDRLVTVRFDEEELAELRKQPGETDAARLRSLLHAQGLQASLVAAISADVTKRLTNVIVADGKHTRDTVLGLAQQIQKLLTTTEIRS